MNNLSVSQCLKAVITAISDLACMFRKDPYIIIGIDFQ
jgi:hypothetical protein